MGWASAGQYFDAVAKALIDHGASDELKTEVCSVLIGALQSGDWDTERESLGEFQDDPAIVEAFRRHDVVVQCADETDDGEWCELELDHDGDHEDYLGKTWPRSEATDAAS